ncbi:5'-methylthioadenosine/adenosylhomocysteine nucleosidase [Fusobacterium sp.]|uniref:5'-methylthioadenosine/adenosylhomocysteine nucleosidase n=1 Tax=Fusobacterium sp. TaxID=68766 RepID=UPI0026184C8C|nr:5'-methylthioadenosine/adenosylhomocysteine nucleosidase [Fusobacterium sp.]
MKKSLKLFSLSGLFLLLMGANSFGATSTKETSKIGIIGAMDSEIDLLKKSMTDITSKKIGKITFYQGKLQNKDVVLFRTGIGKVNSAVGTDIAIREYGVNKIIFTGIAGAVDHSLNVLDLVISDKLAQHDFDLTAFGCPLGLIDEEESPFFYADKDLVEVAKKSAVKVLGEDKVHIGTVISGDQFIADKEKVVNLGKTFEAKAVEMEGASVAQVAGSMYKVPFVVLRTISDKADGSAHMSYEDLKPVASDHSAKIVLEMLNNL